MKQIPAMTNVNVARVTPARNASSVIEFRKLINGSRLVGGLQSTPDVAFVCAAAGCISARLVKLKTQSFRAFRGSFANITALTKVGEENTCNENDYLEKRQ